MALHHNTSPGMLMCEVVYKEGKKKSKRQTNNKEAASNNI